MGSWERCSFHQNDIEWDVESDVLSIQKTGTGMLGAMFFPLRRRQVVLCVRCSFYKEDMEWNDGSVVHSIQKASSGLIRSMFFFINKKPTEMLRAMFSL